ncbi:YbdK family carboxylate-amine ligase [Streptomyces sp. APSN-46.1]|uniref:carboxylate-amine ligase n=1 Tax=Streptomyces sp. APSN-46.1 TaxID=2929049 RepID=UPI001FB293F6|nr:YbdK family carboxylate-amine ligase [Streptomyces sp. APSN-46.1]MCJ1676474.1 YbdK family carboxylate-amine ligase [Streptomyces sp. APSN-46.1]
MALVVSASRMGREKGHEEARRHARAAAPEAVESGGQTLTMGVEEEYLLVDRHSRAPVGRGPRVIRAMEAAGCRPQAEFFTAQVEVCTDPTASTSRLRAELAQLRATAAAAAAEEDCLIVASGTSPLPPADPLEVTPGERYLKMAARYAGTVGPYEDNVVCGCHVHIGSLHRWQALGLSNGMRPWLPVLQSLAVNSPFAHGRDTGYASWRAVEHARWPTVGPAPLLDEPGYERLATALVQDGTLLDRGMIYWYARPSEHVPTLEIRVADVNAELDVVVLLAALARGLASALLVDVADGRPPPAVTDSALREAHRRSAVHGLEGDGLDPVSGLSVSPWRRIDDLLALAAPGLEAAGDMHLAETLLGRLRTRGTGAVRQRAAHEHRRRLRDVVDHLARTACP